ncbi:MAG: cysteine hydrolase family protein [Actinomycetota bacterium]
MTTLPGTKTALLVIDVQNTIVENSFNRDQIVSNIAAAVEKARVAEVPVIWIQHSDEDIVLGSEPWQIVPELSPMSNETKIDKHYRSSFVETELNSLLQSLGVGKVVICGAESNNCVRHTSHSALELGYDITLIQDGHTTTGFEWNDFKVDAERVIDEQNTNLMGYQLPGRKAEVVPIAELIF